MPSLPLCSWHILVAKLTMVPSGYFWALLMKGGSLVIARKSWAPDITGSLCALCDSCGTLRIHADSALWCLRARRVTMDRSMTDQQDRTQTGHHCNGLIIRMASSLVHENAAYEAQYKSGFILTWATPSRLQAWWREMTFIFKPWALNIKWRNLFFTTAQFPGQRPLLHFRCSKHERGQWIEASSTVDSVSISSYLGGQAGTRIFKSFLWVCIYII